MNDTSVPILEIDSTDAVLARLTAEWDELTPEAQKAARYVLDNPQDVGVSTVREIAEAANVKPNTVVRMARQAGFEGYEDFRAPFRDAIRVGCKRSQNRAIWAGYMPIWLVLRLKMFRTVLQT
jgi:DNA-binding MurR/RpiR family transcriptional regulator